MLDYSVRCVEIVRDKDHEEVKMRSIGPLSAVAVFGTLEAIALIVLSIHFRDGMALVATLLLSFLSTLIGLGNKWKLQLVKKKVQYWTPPGDVVIRYPRGNFLVVKCTEDVARELYFAPENIQYLVSDERIYRLISLVGTMMLMFGVVALANAELYLQLGFAAAYILLNAAYWLVAAMPSRLHWDTSCYSVKRQRFDKDTPDEKTYIDHNDTFTQALWKVIVATKDTEWVKRGEAAPQTPAWEEWLAIAKSKANEVSYQRNEKDELVTYRVPQWDAQEALGELIKQHRRDVPTPL